MKPSQVKLAEGCRKGLLNQIGDFTLFYMARKEGRKRKTSPEPGQTHGKLRPSRPFRPFKILKEL